jgi:cytochrome c-550 PedF
LVSIALSSGAASAGAHGDVTPHAVDTQGLPQLDKDLLREDPFRANTMAVKIGASAYNQNCARCHGLEAISGGVAPDLRKMDNDCAGPKVDTRKKACVAEMDQYYANSVYKGNVRNGAVYMPPFAGILSQEADGPSSRIWKRAGKNRFEAAKGRFRP